MIVNFALGPPLPRGVPGEGPDCHFSKEIVGFGAIMARIRGLLIFILALSAARDRSGPGMPGPRIHGTPAFPGAPGVPGIPGHGCVRGSYPGVPVTQVVCPRPGYIRVPGAPVYSGPGSLG